MRYTRYLILTTAVTKQKVRSAHVHDASGTCMWYVIEAAIAVRVRVRPLGCTIIVINSELVRMCVSMLTYVRYFYFSSFGCTMCFIWSDLFDSVFHGLYPRENKMSQSLKATLLVFRRSFFFIGFG